MEFEFERQAMRNEPCPKWLDVVDTYVYMSLKYLYAAYRCGLISREKAAEEKKTIIFNSRPAKSKLEFLDRENDYLKKKIGLAAEAYLKERTLENADRLYKAIYNISETEE